MLRRQASQEELESTNEELQSTNEELASKGECGVKGTKPTSELERQNAELVAAREASEAALERYREVFDVAPIGYASLGADQRILEINHAGAALLGSERGRLIGSRFASFVSATTPASVDAALARARETGRSERIEVELCRGDEMFPVLLTVAALKRAEASFLVAFEDISECRAKAAALAESERALRELSARKDEFLAMLSHELRNPLSPIRTSVFVLQVAPPGSAESAHALDILDRSSAHLARLVDDLLDITRIARGKIVLQLAPVEMSELVRRVVEDHRQAFVQRGLSVELQCQPGELWVQGDPARLVQIVSNVIGNAEKFTEPGGQIAIAVEAAAGQIVVRVRDNGVGISSAVLERVFEPFAQAPQPISRQRGGLGLGLAMVKSLVDLHGGRVAVRSDGEGRGTEVMIALPAAQHPAATELRAEPAQRVRHRRVLLIEDQLDVATSLKASLALCGHEVQVAHDGKSGVELARSFRPDIVFCDLGLPDMDGYAVARTFRGQETLRGMCLVALSGYARPDDVARAKEAGFDRHIAKPPKIDELESVLAAVPTRDSARELTNALV